MHASIGAYVHNLPTTGPERDTPLALGTLCTQALASKESRLLEKWPMAELEQKHSVDPEHGALEKQRHAETTGARRRHRGGLRGLPPAESDTSRASEQVTAVMDCKP